MNTENIQSGQGAKKSLQGPRLKHLRSSPDVAQSGVIIAQKAGPPTPALFQNSQIFRVPPPNPQFHGMKTCLHLEQIVTN